MINKVILLILFFLSYISIRYFLDTDECQNPEFNTCNLTISNCVNLTGRFICECQTGYYANNTDNGCIGKILKIITDILVLHFYLLQLLIYIFEATYKLDHYMAQIGSSQMLENIVLDLTYYTLHYHYFPGCKLFIF